MGYTIVGLSKMLGIKLDAIMLLFASLSSRADEAFGRVRFDRKENHCPLESVAATLEVASTSSTPAINQ